MIPDLLHVVPIRDHAMFHWVRYAKDTPVLQNALPDQKLNFIKLIAQIRRWTQYDIEASKGRINVFLPCPHKYGYSNADALDDLQP